jgi:hypothetical protein
LLAVRFCSETFCLKALPFPLGGKAFRLQLLFHLAEPLCLKTLSLEPLFGSGRVLCLADSASFLQG